VSERLWREGEAILPCTGTTLDEVEYSLPEVWMFPRPKCSVSLTLCRRGNGRRVDFGFILTLYEVIENVGRVLGEAIEARRYLKRNLVQSIDLD
jgi:hypothetical protein